MPDRAAPSHSPDLRESGPSRPAPGGKDEAGTTPVQETNRLAQADLCEAAAEIARGSKILQDRSDYVASHVAAQAAQRGVALIEVSRGVADTDFVDLPHIETWPGENDLAGGTLH